MTVDETRYRAAERALWDHWGVTPREHWVQYGTSGPRLRVLEAGDPAGPPVLFVHGASGPAAAGWTSRPGCWTTAACCWTDRAAA